MAQPQSAPQQHYAHCPDCAVAHPVVAHIAHASFGQAGSPAAQHLQPSAPVASFTLSETAPMPPQTPATLVACPVPPRPPPPPPRSAQQLRVLVPSGISAGQQLQFITPDGQSMCVTVQQDFAPGTYVMAQYQPLQQPQPQAARPPAPMPGSTPLLLPQVPADADSRATSNSWMVYGLGWLACCFVPLLAPIIWVSLAVSYFCCMSPQQRAQRPRQRGPAMAAGITCLVISLVCAAMAFIALVAFVATLPDDSGMPHPRGNHSYPRPDWPRPSDHQLRGMVQTAHPYSMQESPWAILPADSITEVSTISSQELQVTENTTTSEPPCRFAKAAQQFKNMVLAKKAQHEVLLKKLSFDSHGEDPGAKELAMDKPSGPCPFKRVVHNIKRWLSGQEELFIE